MLKTPLHNEISALIATKREDDYWDFKREHHNDKAALLHDILCMANSLNDRDCYIILGVDDENGGIVGVEKNPKRRNQQNIIDFLKTKKFAGDNRPKVEVHTLIIESHEIDVIVVLNTLETPYYLREDYHGNGKKRKTVKASTIYTRVGDTNTPIDSSADYSNVEYLWKKRMGLHLTPSERFHWLLQNKSQWKNGEENHYHTQHPEFTLSFEDIERGSNEFYSYVMMNPSTSYGMIRANYYGTTLYRRQTIYLDSGRYMTVVPDGDLIYLDQYHQESLSVRYYIVEDISYKFHLYLWDENNHEASRARERFSEVVLVFYTGMEKREFFCFICSILGVVSQEIESEKEKNMSRIRGENEQAKSALATELATGIILNKKLVEFRNNG